ncbi:MAG: hypothetical protein II726_02200 [Elusimicrobiaceae bacterium]|nr:hypothetical protein [Elusimicrobiaceae bacterium]
MPNKDSFTFSDKLRKSKSVPLSKRLPSIVGGKNTQKRTLVQRAQRDLPFILVAALALLLLPFLSRNGSDDIAGTGDIQWGSELEDAPSFQEGGYNDIQPSGAMKDPLDLILRPTSAVEAVGNLQPRKRVHTAAAKAADMALPAKAGAMVAVMVPTVVVLAVAVIQNLQKQAQKHLQQIMIHAANTIKK